jgi:DNA-binding PadR family transcriptional regulator
MISEKLLRSKGTINGLLLLSSEDSETYDIDTVAESMDMSSGTTRERLESLQDSGLVDQSAELVDGRPRRVFSLTDDGEKLAKHLENIID